MKLVSQKIFLGIMASCLLPYIQFASAFNILVVNKANELMYISPVPAGYDCSQLSHESPGTQEVTSNETTVLTFNFLDTVPRSVCLSYEEALAPTIITNDQSVPFLGLHKISLYDKNYGFDVCFKVNGVTLPGQGLCNASRKSR